MPRQRRARHRSAADGRYVDLRQQPGEHLQHDRAGAPERHAVVRRQDPDAADLDARGLRALAQRAEHHGCPLLAPGSHDDVSGLHLAAGSREAGAVVQATGVGDAVMLQGGLRGALNQSVLEASGPQAAKVERLWWIAFTTAAIVYVLTMGALWFAARRARRRELRGELLDETAAEPRMTRAVTWGTAATLVILLLFL